MKKHLQKLGHDHNLKASQNAPVLGQQELDHFGNSLEMNEPTVLKKFHLRPDYCGRDAALTAVAAQPESNSPADPNCDLN